MSLQLSLLFVLVTVGCSADDGAGGSSGAGGSGGTITLSDVVFDPPTAAAGATVKVSGLEVDACPLRTSEIRIAGETAPAVLNDRHEVLVRLPLFYDERTRWAAPPSGSQDVEIFCEGTLLATFPDAISITELPPAPGTTRQLVADYQSIVSDYEAVTEAIAPEPGIQQQVFTALFAGLEEIALGTGPGSLPALLAQLGATEPDVLALMDAILAVGDVDESVAAFRVRLEGLRDEALSLAPAAQSKASASSPTIGRKDAIFDIDAPIRLTDTELANALSLYDGLKSFSTDFIGDTAQEFGLAANIITIVVKSKLAEGLSTTLTLLDYVLNKVVVSALPAKLDSIELTLTKTHLDNSEMTLAQFWLRASNVPEDLKISDITSAIMTSLGIAASGGASSGAQTLSWINAWEDIVPSYALTFFDLVDRAFKKYADENDEGFAYDLEVVSIVPQMTFEALGQTRELYLLWPDQSNVIHPLSNELQWRASDTYWGSASVSVTPTATAFGPFGDVRSNSVLVEVGELRLILDRYLVYVEEGSSDAFGVRLSNAVEDEVTVYATRSSGDPDISVPSGTALFFDDSSWDSYQDVGVTAAEDEDQEDGVATITARANIDVSGQLIEASLTAIEIDNDRPYFVLDPPSVRIPEGETAEVQVTLSHPPMEKIEATATYSSGDRDIEVTSPTLMRFDEESWNVPQVVTLYARLDEDRLESRTQVLVSANPPAEVEERYITATEDEAGAMLTIHWQDWNEHQRATVLGSTVVELDPTNFELPLQRSGTLRAYFVSDYTRHYTGTAYLQIMNHPLEPACPCVPEVCYERQSPDDTVLAISGFITWDDCDHCASYGVYMTLPFVGGATSFETTCRVDTYGVSYSAELIR